MPEGNNAKYYQNEYLFSEIYLQEITQNPEKEEIHTSLNTLKEYREFADTSSLKAWKDSFIHQVLFALGFNVKAETENLTLLFPIGEASNPISLVFCLLPDVDLNNTTIGRNWSEKIIRNLRDHDIQWGLLTNGEKWRVYHSDEPTPYETYLEIDLSSILENNAYDDFQIFYKFMRVENFTEREDDRCQFDIFKKESQDKINYIENELENALKQKEEGGQGVLSSLCMGYVEYMRQNGIIDFDDEERRRKIYHGAMLYMFRLLFLYYADSRGLLSDQNHHLLSEIRQAAYDIMHKGDPKSDSYHLWNDLETIFVDIDQTYNGGLFNPHESEFTYFIEESKLRNTYLAPSIYHLAFYNEASGEERKVSYKDMSVRHLGTLYEGLLEHKLFIANEDIEVKVTKGKIKFIPESMGGKIHAGLHIDQGQVYFGTDIHERKTSGSYFTPEDVVDFIVNQSLQPKIHQLSSDFIKNNTELLNACRLEHIQSKRTQLISLLINNLKDFILNKILTISILDPSMGSGHFLINAANFLTNFITEFINSFGFECDLESSPDYWRRRIVESCLFGVDVNPLAVELAKLSLWLFSMMKEKPLSFINHHLKCGDSLSGARLKDIGKFQKTKKEADISEKQLSIFDYDQDFPMVVAKVINSYSLINTYGSGALSQIYEKKELLEKISRQLLSYKKLCDFHINAITSNEFDELTYKTVITNLRKKLFFNNGDINYFHWELEFPDVLLIEDPGFDVVIGNPPYVRQKPTKIHKMNFKSSKSRNLYAWFVELGFHLSKRNGVIGMIVPLSIMISNSMKPIRRLIIKNKGYNIFTNFDNIPDCIFNSGKVSDNTNRMNSQRTTILSVRNGAPKSKFETTDLLRWRSSERSDLFDKIKYANISNIIEEAHFPMVGDKNLVQFLEKLQSRPTRIKDLISKKGSKYKLFVPTRARYFIPASPEDLQRSNQKILNFSNLFDYRYAFVLLSSNVFYWYWRVYGDGFDVYSREILDFPCPLRKPKPYEIEVLADELESVIPECRVYKRNAGKMIPNINFNKRMDVLIHIDRWIVNTIDPNFKESIEIFAQKKSNSFIQDFSPLSDYDEESI